MSATGATVRTPDAAEPVSPPPNRSRWRLVGAATMMVLVVVGVVIAVTNPFGNSGHPRSNATATSRVTVRRGALAAQVSTSGTLGYLAQPDGSPYSVVNHASGTLTALPSTGQVVTQGHALYRISDKPVVLLNGGTPAYRSLSQGDSGPDVRELNADLVALGYATRSQLDRSSNYFSSETASAVERLQGKLGVDETGSLALGDAVFLRGPLRISKVTATLGASAPPGAPIARATSTKRTVKVDLDAAQQASVKVGDKALVTLPDNQVTPGVVTSIGTVASSAGSSSGSGASTTTIPVYLTLRHPSAAGSLDQAPVQVQITTAGVTDVLIVPITALLAQPGGRTAVESVDAHGSHHLLAVSIGLFDDADGLVQVSGPLSAGEQVVVPST